VSIITAQRTNALKLPNAALRFRPPDAATETRTNLAAAQAPGQGQRADSGGGGMRQGGQGGGGGMRQGGPGGGGPGGGPAEGARRPRSERQISRTVYVLAKPDPKDPDTLKPKPVQIKVGISDGISTEVLDGLQEGMQVVTGIITSDLASSRPGSPPSNPFGGGFRRF